MSRYQEEYARWQANATAFWEQAAEMVDWTAPWTEIHGELAGQSRWFVGASCNTCWNAVDRHVAAGRGAVPALVFDSAMTHQSKTYTYAELRDEVAWLAAGLRTLGVRQGDRVLLYMPMVPEAVFAMLACARLGAVHSVVFGGFAPAELAARITDAQPTLILTASCGLEPGRTIAYKPLVDQALGLACATAIPQVVLQRPQLQATLRPLDHDWATLVAQMRQTDQRAECVPVNATDPLYILYTSGTTGHPKGIVRDNGGHMVALLWSMANVYGARRGDVFWAASDVGWVVGHSYIVYGPLLYGITTLLYEGKPVGTPDASAFWRVIAQHGVTTLFTAPTALRAIKREDPNGAHLLNYPRAQLRALFLAGERADPDTVRWAETQLGVPVIDHWWQTETGWAIAANPLGLGALPTKLGSPAVPMPGYIVHVLDEGGHEVPRGQLGAICIKLPLPPGSLPTLWQADARFREAYLRHFPGYYETADAGYVDDDGYLYIMARTDDVINVAGHRLSTGAMEEVLANHPAVAECAVLGVADALKGQLPLGFIIVKAGVSLPAAQIEAECAHRVREQIGAIASLKAVITVTRLPKTRSGKILRGTMRKLADGDAWKMPATIDDASALDEIAQALAKHGLGAAAR